MVLLMRPTSDVIGRADDVRLVQAALTDNRLVTLIGPGGVGKTSLAVEVSNEVEPEFARVVGVGLTDADVRDEVVGLVSAAVLGEPAGDLTRTASALAAEATLLVLDNCESVIDAVADVVHELLGAGADTRILATSRRPLELADEATVPVRPLPFPTDLTEAPVTDYAAVQLFLERVRQADPVFELTDANRGTVAAICAAADGVPLVLELAASLVRVRSLTDILAVVTERPEALAGNRRDLHDHQRSVEASLQWSRRFLTVDECRLLDRLSVFAGGFTAAAARQVGDVADDLALTRLVDHSLVTFDADQGRYRLLEVIRADAEARVDPADWAELEQRHLEWCQDLVAEIGGRVAAADPDRTFPLYSLEIPNLSTALKRRWQAGDVAACRGLVAPVANWWLHHSRPDGVAHWDRLIDDEATAAERAGIESALAYYWSHQGDHARSLDYAQRSIEHARAAGDVITEAGGRMAAGNAHASLGDRDVALEVYGEALAGAVEFGDEYSEQLARVLLARLDPENAGSHLAGALEIARRGYTVLISMVLVELSRVARAENRLTEARAHVDEAVAISRSIDFGEGLGTALTAQADVAAARGDLDTARAAYGEALAIGRRICHEGVAAPARAGLDRLPERASAPADRQPSADAGEELTDRELAVARLLRGDLTQREIADELYIAPSTVKTHIKSIYRKLDVAKRSHAITRAAELGLFDR